jgi:hypothetical protein
MFRLIVRTCPTLKLWGLAADRVSKQSKGIRMAYARGKAAWQEMRAKHAGTCTACKDAFDVGDPIVVRKVGRKLTARHERCRDAVPVPTVTTVEQGVYRVRKSAAPASDS